MAVVSLVRMSGITKSITHTLASTPKTVPQNGSNLAGKGAGA